MLKRFLEPAYLMLLMGMLGVAFGGSALALPSIGVLIAAACVYLAQIADKLEQLVQDSKSTTSPGKEDGNSV